MIEGEPVHIHPGAAIVVPADRVLALDAGQVEVRADARLLEVAGAERWFNLAAALAGRPGEALELRARTPSRARTWPFEPIQRAGDDPRAAAALTAALARECLRREHEARAVLRRADDFFRPGAELYPPPYAFGPFRCLLAIVEHDPAALARLLPPGLTLLPGAEGRALVMISDIEGARADAVPGRAWGYREVVPFIPVACPSRLGVGLHAPELFADATMPILLGREVYGFPKRLGRVELDARAARLLADHEVALDLRWEGADTLDGARALERLTRALLPAAPAALGPLVRRGAGLFDALGLPLAQLPTRAFMRKRILDPRAAPWDPRSGRGFAIDELVEVPFEIEALRGPAALVAPALELGRTWPIGQGRLVDALACEVGFRLHHARRVRDYLRGHDA